MKPIAKTIYMLVVMGILLVAIKVYFAQNNIESTTELESYGWYYKALFYGNIFISIASILSFIYYRQYFPYYITLCYVGLLISVFIASFSSFGEYLKTPSFLYSSKGIGTFINIGLIFFTAEIIYTKKIFKVFYYLCFFFILAGLLNLAKVGIGAGRNQFLYAILDFTIYLIWVFPYFFLQKHENKKLNIINLFIFLILFLFVLSIGARSYLAIYFIFLIIKFKEQLQRKNSILFIVGVFILVGATFLLVSNSGLSKIAEGAFTNLSERASEDSRSGQLTEFWDQYDFHNFLSGVGPTGTWVWSVAGIYAFLDNQFLLIGWWAGAPTLIIYVYFLVKSFFYKRDYIEDEPVKGLQLIIGLWILACLGFAIYVSLSSELYYYFITLLMGLHVCNLQKIKTDSNFE